MFFVIIYQIVQMYIATEYVLKVAVRKNEYRVGIINMFMVAATLSTVWCLYFR